MKRTLLAASFLACSLAASAQGVAMKAEGAMRWACGGAGADERAALAALRPQANLELLFITAKRGGYLADVEVSLARADGGGRGLQMRADGPICLVFAPAGRYRIEASYTGVKRTAEATAATAAGKPAQAVLRFPDEPWDGTRATEEEKQQAKTP